MMKNIYGIATLLLIISTSVYGMVDPNQEDYALRIILFKMLDLKNIDHILYSEFCNINKYIQSKLTVEETVVGFYLIDRNHNGEISENEFIKAPILNPIRAKNRTVTVSGTLKIFEKVSSFSENLRIFNEMDTNHDGYLSLDEFTNAMPRASIGECFVEPLFKMLDHNRDKRISIEEYYTLIEYSNHYVHNMNKTKTKTKLRSNNKFYLIN